MDNSPGPWRKQGVVASATFGAVRARKLEFPGVLSSNIPRERNSDLLGRVRGDEEGKYEGTVPEAQSMVPFRHCLCGGKQAELGLCGQGSCCSHLFYH
jgi:hypothetical protein